MGRQSSTLHGHREGSSDLDEARDSGSRPRLSVAVIVPVGPKSPHLAACVDSLRSLSPSPAQVFYVLDGHRQGPSGLVGGEEILHLESVSGPAAARNLGAAEAKADVLLFVDADVEVPGDLVGRVVDILAASPGLSAVFGSYDARPSAPGLVSRWRNLLHHHVHQRSRPEATSFWAGCGAFRAGAFASLGGFDESFLRPSVEDIDLGYRASAEGHRIRLEPALQVRHHKGWGLGGVVVTDLFHRAAPWTELLVARRSAPVDLNLRWEDRVAVALACVGLVSCMASFWWGWTALLLGVVGLGCALLLDRPFFSMLAGVGGSPLAVAALPLQLIFRWCSGLGLCLGLFRAALRLRRPPGCYSR